MNRPPRTQQSAQASQSQRRGFAIAMVVVLMIIVGLGIGLAMSRFSVQSKTIARQVSGYQAHHLGRGLQEATGAWLRQQNGRNLLDVLEPDTGHAMDILLDDGSTVSVFLLDAQGAALSNLAGRTDREIEEGGALLRNLSLNTTDTQYLQLTRPFGPTTVSVHSASPLVLDAGARVVAPELAERFLAGLELLKSNSAQISRTELTRAANEAGLSANQRSAALRLFATDIELWAVIIEVRAGRGASQGRLISRYGGITRIRTNNRSSSSNEVELGAFITWKEIQGDSQELDLSELY